MTLRARIYNVINRADESVEIEAQTIGEELFLKNLFDLIKKYPKLSDSELEFIKKLAE